MKLLTEDKVVLLLKRRVAESESAAQAARELGVPASHVCDVLHGRRAPVQRLVEGLGLRRVTRYEAQ